MYVMCKTLQVKKRPNAHNFRGVCTEPAAQFTNSWTRVSALGRPSPHVRLSDLTYYLTGALQCLQSKQKIKKVSKIQNNDT